MAEALDTLLKGHGATRYKPTTLKEAKRLIERLIKPALGSIKIGDLTRGKVRSWHQDHAAAPYVANRALAFLRSALNVAVEEWELIRENPAAAVKPFQEVARERFFSEDELARLGAAISELEGQAAPGCGPALRLLALTGNLRALVAASPLGARVSRSRRDTAVRRLASEPALRRAGRHQTPGAGGVFNL